MSVAFKMCKDILFFHALELWGVFLVVCVCVCLCLIWGLLCSFLFESVCEGTVKELLM